MSEMAPFVARLLIGFLLTAAVLWTLMFAITVVTLGDLLWGML